MIYSKLLMGFKFTVFFLYRIFLRLLWVGEDFYNHIFAKFLGMIMAKVEEKTLESMENSVCEVKQLFDLFVRTTAPAVVKNEQFE
jgi:hypothetical protein